jgi:hypothetical protein
MGRNRWLVGLGVVGLGTVALQALALGSRYFQPWLSADYIYPQLLAEDVLAGNYPLAGWTLSSAPYFFPDLVVMLALCAFGGPGTVLPVYGVFSYVALAVCAGWSLQVATRAGGWAWVGGVTLVNGLLAWQGVGDHAHYLWLLGTVGFHGGAVVLGLALFALWTGPTDAPPTRARWWGGVGLFFLGLLSDTLFLTQAVIPLGIALWFAAGRRWREASRLRAYARALAVAAAGVATVKVGLALTGYFHFSKVLRYAPTPPAIMKAVVKFYHDALAVLVPGAWGFWLLLAGAVIVGALLGRRSPANKAAGADELRFPAGFVGLALAATVAFPLLTTYWRDEHHVRYLLPLLVLPGWLLTVVILRTGAASAGRRWLVALGMSFTLLAGWAVATIKPAALRWPYPESQARLDAYLAEHQLTHGLSDYWTAHQAGTLARVPLRLFALRPNARAFFWNNNAFWFYDSSGREVSLTLTPRAFVITNGLDEAAVLARFGEPRARENVGGYSVWLYDTPAGRATLTDAVRAEVDTFLRGRPGAERLPGAR